MIQIPTIEDLRTEYANTATAKPGGGTECPCPRLRCTDCALGQCHNILNDQDDDVRAAYLEHIERLIDLRNRGITQLD